VTGDDVMDGAARTVNVKAWLSVPALLVAVTVTAWSPTTSGIQSITPVAASMVIPAGAVVSAKEGAGFPVASTS